MTIVGHSIVGLTVGAALLPRGLSRWSMAGFLALMVAMALLPDWRIPFHRNFFRYYQHHSLPVNGAILAGIGVVMAAAGWLKTRTGRLALIGMTVAVLSHLLMDSFYSHGRGLNVLWPIGDWRLVLPLPWLHVQTRLGALDWHHNRIRLVEVLTFGPLLAGVVAVRAILARRRQPA